MQKENHTTVSEFLLVGFNNLHEFRILVFISLLSIYIAILIGNLIIIVLVVFNIRLHSPMYFFLGNLSFSEILFTTVIVPKMFCVILTEKGAISFDNCIIQMYMFGSFASVECFLLTVMSYDRYLAICNPMRYSVIMNTRVCMNLITFSWIGGFMAIFILIIPVFKLLFCDSNVIDHLFCDLPHLFKISCSDTFVAETMVFFFSSSIVLFPFIFVLGTYTCIILTIVRIPSTVSRSKAFATCSSHVAVVSTYYGTLIMMYVVPSKNHSLIASKLLSLLYTVVTPLLNPIIYSLRNHDIKVILRMLLLKMYE
ncbi:olfactory receptor 11L1-like [Pelobates fuscus]|uniref:olfactory receptor 11L1-like n=1 Tax=Pelobates fuscus TaxID=191477 RepID=UPI002FE4CDAF